MLNILLQNDNTE